MSKEKQAVLYYLNGEIWKLLNDRVRKIQNSEDLMDGRVYRVLEYHEDKTLLRYLWQQKQKLLKQI